MKCVQVVGQGVPIRMTDDDAARLVREGDGQYCPRKTWRLFYDESEFWKGRRQWRTFDHKNRLDDVSFDYIEGAPHGAAIGAAIGAAAV